MQRLIGIIRELECCAKQNEADAQAPGGWETRDCIQAGAVAREQRRMLRILKGLLKAFHLSTTNQVA